MYSLYPLYPLFSLAYQTYHSELPTMIIIPERQTPMANVTVGRILPYRQKRMVSAFTFIDHFGPVEIGPNDYMDVDQHPHIGIATLTYLFDGIGEHRDSLGSHQIIKPGDVNLMIAGGGITHSERTPEAWKDGRRYTSHGVQIWIALPKAHETMGPEFHHVSESDLHAWKIDDADMKLIIGNAFGQESKLPHCSDYYLIEMKTSTTHQWKSSDGLYGEVGFYILSGGIQYHGDMISQGNMIVYENVNDADIKIDANSHILIFGGKPLPEKRLMHWNFVATNQELITDAVDRWKNKQFPKIPGDDTYIPIPEY